METTTLVRSCISTSRDSFVCETVLVTSCADDAPANCIPGSVVRSTCTRDALAQSSLLSMPANKSRSVPRSRSEQRPPRERSRSSRWAPTTASVTAAPSSAPTPALVRTQCYQRQRRTEQLQPARRMDHAVASVPSVTSIPAPVSRAPTESEVDTECSSIRVLERSKTRRMSDATSTSAGVHARQSRGRPVGDSRLRRRDSPGDQYAPPPWTKTLWTSMITAPCSLSPIWALTSPVPPRTTFPSSRVSTMFSPAARLSSSS